MIKYDTLTYVALSVQSTESFDELVARVAGTVFVNLDAFDFGVNFCLNKVIWVGQAAYFFMVLSTVAARLSFYNFYFKRFFIFCDQFLLQMFGFSV